MKATLSRITLVTVLCGWAGYAGPWPDASPSNSVERPAHDTQVEVAFDSAEAPEPQVAPAHSLESAQDSSQWGVAALQPDFSGPVTTASRPTSGLSRIFAFVLPGLAMAASPPPIGNVPNYPLQRQLKVSWTLQGMAEDASEGGEGAEVGEGTMESGG